MTASTEIFLSVIIDGAAIASVILALLWVVAALESVLTNKIFTKGGD
jgi:hypothetical protein